MSQGKLRTPLFDAMFLAGETSGQGTSTDLNGFKPEGVARLDSTATYDIVLDQIQRIF